MITFTNAAQLNQVSGGYTLTAWWPNSFRREQGEPSQPGDVLSVTPEGSFQVRPPGTAGPWEVCQISGVTLLYNPEGAGKPVYWLIPSGV